MSYEGMEWGKRLIIEMFSASNNQYFIEFKLSFELNVKCFPDILYAMANLIDLKVSVFIFSLKNFLTQV